MCVIPGTGGSREVPAVHDEHGANEAGAVPVIMKWGGCPGANEGELSWSDRPSWSPSSAGIDL